MPELGEVEYYRKTWNPGLAAHITKVHLNSKARVFNSCDTEELKIHLPGKCLAESFTHGKRLLFRISPTGWLTIHLGMTGRLDCASHAMVPGKHDHLVIYTDNEALAFSDYRKFGRVDFKPHSEAPDWWQNRAREILDPAFDFKYLKAILQRFPRTPMKTLLMKQDHFPGIGNWMADEILWRAKMDPRKRPQELSPQKFRILLNKLKEVCADAMRVVADGWKQPPEYWLFNHRWRNGGTCPRTGKPLERIQINGRTTCFSPNWQQ